MGTLNLDILPGLWPVISQWPRYLTIANLFPLHAKTKQFGCSYSSSKYIGCISLWAILPHSDCECMYFMLQPGSNNYILNCCDDIQCIVFPHCLTHILSCRLIWLKRFGLAHNNQQHGLLSSFLLWFQWHYLQVAIMILYWKQVHLTIMRLKITGYVV